MTAAKAAVNLVNAILLGHEFTVDHIVRDLIEIREQRLLGPSTQAIVNEAEQRQIPWLRLDEYNLVQLGTGRHFKRIRATLTSETSSIALESAADKNLTARMLTDAGVPVPRTVAVASVEEAVAFQREVGQPVVIKPREGVRLLELYEKQMQQKTYLNIEKSPKRKKKKK